MSEDEGYGYEWEATLVGGPADGCLDRTIAINGETPPDTLIKIVDGHSMKRETLGEKLIESLTIADMDGSQRVAVYSLREVDEEERCIYDYTETTTMRNYREKYRG